MAKRVDHLLVEHPDGRDEADHHRVHLGVGEGLVDGHPELLRGGLRGDGDRAVGDLQAAGLRIVRRQRRELRGVADDVSATPAQVALAWLMTRPQVTPIASATSLAQLEDIMGAADLVLPASALEALDAASRPAA